jgi:hypothetical protein
MWRVLEEGEHISLVAMVESRVYILEFADAPMLLEQVREASSIDLEQEYSARVVGISSRSSESELQSDVSI